MGELCHCWWKSPLRVGHLPRKCETRDTVLSGSWESYTGTGGRFKNTYELLNLRALQILMLYKSHIFQCMGKIFCVEFQRVPLKFHTKYLTHTLKDVDFTCENLRALRIKSSYVFLNPPPPPPPPWHLYTKMLSISQLSHSQSCQAYRCGFPTSGGVLFLTWLKFRLNSS